MIIGLIKNNTTIYGVCSVQELIIGSNKTKTVVCDNNAANSKDKIIFICEEEGCQATTVIGKRIFADINKFECLCRKCRTVRTSLDRYGRSSPNQVASIKEKQHQNKSRSEPFTDGNNKKPRKTKSSEELSQLRSDLTKKKWAKGDYEDVDYSEVVQKIWQRPGYKDKMKKIMSSSEVRDKKSKAAKANWENDSYRETVIRNLKLSINSNPQEIQRRRNFLLQKWRDGIDEMLEVLSKHVLTNSFSKLHLQITQELKLRDKGFKGEQRVSRYIVDELNPNTMTIIEINGNYVHANPKIYSPDSIIKLPGNSYTAAEKWESDSIKIDNLKKLGYKVIVIWEGDDLESVKDLL